MYKKKKVILTIAGSDSSSGAGIQSDLKTFHNHGLYGLTVITSVTSQNTKGVQSTYELPSPVVKSQLKSLFDDFDIKVVKIGMLSSGKIINVVSDFLRNKKTRLIVDPVILSKNKFPLLSKSGLVLLKKRLLPLAYLLTPNLYEAEHLSGMKIKSASDINLAAKLIHSYGCKYILIKGGHFSNKISLNKATDILFDGKQFKFYPGNFVNNKNNHGIGCTYSSAIASNLCLGYNLNESIIRSKKYISKKLKTNPKIGKGTGPVEV